MLSIGGRFTLNKAVFSSLPIYMMSIYKTRVGVLRKMESIRRRFFNCADINENKMSMIGWEKIMASRKKRVLGISSFFAQNHALLFKWIWRFRSKDSSLWYKVIKAMYGDCGSLDNIGTFVRSSTWTTIVRECGNLSSKGINLLSHMKKKVGNMVNTLFWVDSWLYDIPLMQLYPRMFALDCNKISTVEEKINASSISCSFRRQPRGSFKEEQFSKFIEDDHLLLAVGAPTRWVKEVPIKINIMAWKVSLDKLPSRLNLSLRGIEFPSITCPICSCAGESCSHLFSLVLWPGTLLPNWLDGGSLIARIYSHTMIGLNGFTLFVSLKDEGIELVADQEKDDEVEGRHADRQAELYKLDLDHSSKVLSMQEDDTEVQEAVEIVTTAKLMTEVVTAATQAVVASTPILAAKPKILNIAAAPAVSTKRRKGVVIRDPEKELHSDTTAETPNVKDKGKGILIEAPKPMKKKDQIEMDAECKETAGRNQ
nr:hypothetical protein [Tanacetum cinerariifolium]